ncbi:hypothetical protein BB560_000112 [Smittium megazygosporum]|uniref:CBM1 domain-containing protein n=1 Tax=Smittium megazygosporum TaxID=133381 RepID=A0A2T9ZLC4_9FUNG|nr:hypothetical protein BB560_000112 [Smittium megazygosporum]
MQTSILSITKYLVLSSLLLFSNVYSQAIEMAVFQPFTDPNGQVYTLQNKIIIDNSTLTRDSILGNTLLYTPQNISSTGWKSENLDFSLGVTGDNRNFPGIICTDCVPNTEYILPRYNLNGIGLCSVGWCQYQSSPCIYNLDRAFWYNCIPNTPQSNDPASLYVLYLYKDRIDVKPYSPSSSTQRKLPVGYRFHIYNN